MGRAAHLRALCFTLGVVAPLLAAGGPARAQMPVFDLSLPEVAEIATADDDAEVRERLRFLEERLEAVQGAGQVWHWTWFGIHGAGIAAGVAELAIADDADGRVAGLVNAGKSVVGIGRILYDPLPARLGADPVRALPDATPAQRQVRLRLAEALLEESAERAERKYTPWPHLGNALINLVGGGIIWGLGDWRDAAISTGLGLALGEVRIWTLPTQPARDLDDYRARFGGTATGTGISVELTPRPNGMAITFRF
jgi:hypothetical protein